ncbi:hypothetical protein AOLI_G00262080 [Acnodon oligacanthus]
MIGNRDLPKIPLKGQIRGTRQATKSNEKLQNRDKPTPQLKSSEPQRWRPRPPWPASLPIQTELYPGQSEGSEGPEGLECSVERTRRSESSLPNFSEAHLLGLNPAPATIHPARCAPRSCRVSSPQVSAAPGPPTASRAQLAQLSARRATPPSG